jgi:hypothetical protein
VPSVPDTKDWTWVIGRRCEECGFDASAVSRRGIAGLVRDNAEEWERILGRGSDLRTRPWPGRWSALEYACHVRDVFALYDGRLRLMLSEDEPTFLNRDQDEAAVEGRYNEQDPAQVARELTKSAGQIAGTLDRVEGEDWERTGTRDDGVRFTIDSLARYMIHDPVHHVHDVATGFAELDRRG